MRYRVILPVVAALSGCAASRAPQPAAVPVADDCPQTDIPLPLTRADEARQDIAAGRLILKGYGLEPAPQPLVELLRDRLGVELIASGNCSAIGIIEFEAYNRVMREEIARRFGPDALRNLHAEAARLPVADAEP